MVLQKPNSLLKRLLQSEQLLSHHLYRHSVWKSIPLLIACTLSYGQLSEPSWWKQIEREDNLYTVISINVQSIYIYSYLVIAHQRFK